VLTAPRLIVIPLSFLRRLDSLKYTSVIALVSIAYLVVLVVYHFGSGDTLADRGEVHWLRWQGIVPTLASFPVIVFAYTCHQNVSLRPPVSILKLADTQQMFSILNEIRDNSPFRTTAVVFASNGVSSSIYVLVAITGYLSFGDAVLGNIVGQYRPSVFSTIGRAAIVILVMFSYPLQVHPCRASVDAVSKWRPATKSNQELTPASGSPSRGSLLQQRKVPMRPKAEDMSDLRFAVITTLIIILSYMVAMTVSSLEKVLAYVGSTGSTSISFILPGLFYYKISSPDSPHHQRLLKDEDDNDEHNSSGSESEDGSTSSRTAGNSWRESWAQRVRGRRWRGEMLRTLSLALAFYGLAVMVVCLVLNTFFIVAH